MRLLTTKEIEESLPSLYEKVDNDDGYNFLGLSSAKNIFGKNVVELTPSLAQMVIGKTFQGLAGQHWDDDRFRSVCDRMKDLRTFTGLRFDYEEMYGGHPELVLKTTDSHGWCVENEREYEFNAYLFEDRYVTGSGCDPIYIFVTDENEIVK